MSKTQRMVMIAALSAVSFVLMFFSFSIIPGASFLKIEFSIIPVLIGMALLDLKSAYVILILRSLLKLLLNNSGVNDFIGLPMNIVALGLFVTVFALIWKSKQTVKQYLGASLIGTIVLTLSMVILNYFYAIPLYAKFANFDIGSFIGIGKYMMAMVVPFNIVESIIFAISFYFVYIACKPILERYTQ
ncbi:ECF transporter S component [Streptococcus parauberis]|uniref:Riboflavin transporter n=1 Tax=Streptococcus parauberis KRS-02083 TaxID=1207545 RepID=A0ABN0IUK5_9STRE|nr:ECF transporter S component [Streptococcus parauberis]AEF25804.1 membrane protein [Streptococcus parauberis KCTC 11537]AUT05422.1 Riboflavin transporter RibU [Streptococcus parauberis]EMF49235.1 Substrate-specific component RibU of riboflavin ECF transporter [Streptococcus parauberis KRS-02109]EMG26559.1 riboflavin ECF transporter [Streptococcus parauberis KRS-02083]KYP17468.1 Riboflavin transporter RibU [Streptococcus parauberis]